MATTSKNTAKTTERVDKAGGNHVKALSEFQYSDLRLSRQQVFELRGERNDQTLLDLRYLVRVPKGTALVQCAECGALFDNEHWLTMHGEQWHDYECECGWTPTPGTLDKTTAMRRHNARCPLKKQQRDRAHVAHVERAKQMQGT